MQIIEVETEIFKKEKAGSLSDHEIENLTTLKIQLHEGDCNLIIKMIATDLMTDLYSIINKHWYNRLYLIALTNSLNYSSENKNFEVFSRYPLEVFQRNDTRNLMDLGLFPNSFLFCRLKA